MSDVTALLEKLGELQEQRKAAVVQKEQLVAAAIPADVSIQLQAIELEFGSMLEAADQNIKQLTDQIKALVVQNGKSVKGSHYQAVYNAGRVKWNDDGLRGFAVAHPEIMQFRTTGEPSVTLREVG